jgi:hypothetical protein
MFQSTHEIFTKERLIGKTLLLSDYKNSSNNRSLKLTPFKVYSSSTAYWDTTSIEFYRGSPQYLQENPGTVSRLS